MIKPKLGVCYYPEHWPRANWSQDANRMKVSGLSLVRIGEFSWSRLEAVPGKLTWDWLDEAIEILGAAGLEVVLGTPTATPPRWMIDKHPDMLAADEQGNPRNFGSRRHYCFSHQGYRQEAARIVELMAERYGDNPHVVAWQTDNEYGCHDTTVSYSDAALQAFRQWLAGHYADIESLNKAWGNVFWSMEYCNFEQIDLPIKTVTEANPAHRYAFLKFSSDQVVSFNRLQCDILRRFSSAPIAHNYMGSVTDFDHFATGSDLDIASWDSYPLGFLEDRVQADDEQCRRFMRQGDPDYQAMHHDLYRSVGQGRLWVMEQQPGPVNWADYNPAPLPGMVKLWSLEAMAHGAEAVCYFRWRQAPFAQEQMHAGLLRVDGEAAPALAEVELLAREIGQGPTIEVLPAKVAIIYDYDANYAWQTQPHGKGLNYSQLVYEFYRGLRQLGQSIDFLATDTEDFSGYQLLLVPGMMVMPEALKIRLANSTAEVLLGPRTAARNKDFEIPSRLPPAVPGLDVRVTSVESLRPDIKEPCLSGGGVHLYREFLEGNAKVMDRTEDGEALTMHQNGMTYLAAWPDRTLMKALLAAACERADLEFVNLPPGVRIRDTARERFWINYEAEAQEVEGRQLAPAEVLREQRD